MITPPSWPAAIPPLRPGRAHEAMGPAARVFAAALIGAGRGPALWICNPRPRERLDPYGLARFCDPGRLILVETREAVDVFWAMEEGLRSGALGVVIAESRKPATLTQGRRLQLAAEAGGGVGLLLGPDNAPKNTAAETRWRIAPMPGGGWLWELAKNKRGPVAAWRVAPDLKVERMHGQADDGSADNGQADSCALAAAARRRAAAAA